MADLKGLDSLTEEGSKFLSTTHDPATVQNEYREWSDNVSKWIGEVAPDSGLKADWIRLSSSPLQKLPSNIVSVDQYTWDSFRAFIKDKLHWLSGFPIKIRMHELSQPIKRSFISEFIDNTSSPIEILNNKQQQPVGEVADDSFVDESRISSLSDISNDDFDLSKLIRICEELNINFKEECYLSVAMLTRSLLDHVPPIFGANNFSEVVNNYSGSKSFKDSMNHLENSSRKISDQHLHCQIRKREDLPAKTQINFSQDIDVLLGEIIRLCSQ